MVGKVMRPGRRQDGGVGGCSSRVVCENHLVGSEFYKGMRTQIHFSNIRWPTQGQSVRTRSALISSHKEHSPVGVPWFSLELDPRRIKLPVGSCLHHNSVKQGHGVMVMMTSWR